MVLGFLKDNLATHNMHYTWFLPFKPVISLLAYISKDAIHEEGEKKPNVFKDVYTHAPFFAWHHLPLKHPAKEAW